MLIDFIKSCNSYFSFQDPTFKLMEQIYRPFKETLVRLAAISPSNRQLINDIIDQYAKVNRSYEYLSITV